MEEPQYSEVFLKRQLFKAARLNKPDIFLDTMEKINDDTLQGFSLLSKRDPEGRNVITLALLFASVDVLKAISEYFESAFDMRQLILKQEFDSNTAFGMAISLMQFSQFRKRSSKTVDFLIDLCIKPKSQVSNETDYRRYINLTDRLGRATLHLACMHGVSSLQLT